MFGGGGAPNSQEKTCIKAGKFTPQKLLILVLSLIFLLGGTLSALLCFFNPNSNAIKTGDTTSFVKVNNGTDLWTGSAIKGTTAKELFKMLSNSSTGDYSTLQNSVTTSSPKSATTLRGYTYGKTSSQSIVLTLGGIQWIVTYLSKDKSGNVIATLYQADSSITESTFGNSSSYCGKNNGADGVPTNMYATSYIRAVTLNNGGYYIDITSNDSNPSSVGLKATQSSSHEYALFTVPSLGLTQHIVQPLNVSWQESGQTAKTSLNYMYNLSNENWSDSVTDTTGFWGASYNFAGHYYSNVDGGQSGNGDWKYDYLWLPSLSETGYSGTNGIWQINENERSFSSSNNAWLRSALNYLYAYGAITLNPSGADEECKHVLYFRSVRPALHLNLKSISAVEVSLDQDGGTGGASTIQAYKNDPMPSITLPTRTGFAFGGYFSSTNGTGTKYYNADGTSAINYPASGGPTTLYAYWMPLYTLTINANDSSLGSVQGIAGSYLANSKHKIFAIVKAGYGFLYWSVKNANGTEISKIYENEYTLTMPAHNVTYTAVFGKSIEGILVAATYGGTALVVGDNYESLESTDTITLVATVCVTGYQFKHWQNQDGTILASGEENKTYLIPKSQAMDSIITAVFEPIT